MVGTWPPRYFTRKIKSSGRSRASRQMTQAHPRGARPNLCPETVNRFNARDSKVPNQIGMNERSYKAATGRIDVDRDVEARSSSKSSSANAIA